MVIKKQTLNTFNFILIQCSNDEFVAAQNKSSKTSTDNPRALCASHV